MGFFDPTAVAGPVSGAVLGFPLRAELWAALVGTLAASAIGILTASLRWQHLARAHVQIEDAPALRLVARRVDADRA